MKKYIVYSILASALLFSRCSTDLDVVGDYKETMIVIGLLDQAQPKQYIKITKAFLGEGDAVVYAGVKDSTQFVHALSVQLQRYKNGNPVGAAIILNPDSSIPKDAGVFYSPDQTNAIYSTTAPLFVDSEYHLTVRNNETGKEVTAVTSLIQDITGFSYPVPAGTSYSFVIIGPYPNYPFPISWNSAAGARMYQGLLRLNYIDSTLAGNDTNYVDYLLPELRTDNSAAAPSEGMSYTAKGHDFYKYIGEHLSDYSGLIKRTALKVDLRLYAGSDDLATFIDVNKPSTGIIQERPEFTNIKGGLGIFTARLNRAPLSRPLDAISLDSLACGQFTHQLKFLNSAGSHPCF
ncbi:MAG: hypothetical protein ACJ77K_08305 [Bacteroidia bacterium]